MYVTMLMTKIGDVWNGLKAAILMVIVQIAYTGLNVVYKLAVNDGMNLRVVIAYRFMFATLSIAPLAFFLERKKRPKMTWQILFQSFMCGLFGLEKLNLRTVAGKCKIIGTITAIGGAMILTFFKGIEMGTGSFHVTLLHHHNGHVASPQSSSGVKTLLGALCALGSSCTFALLLIIQAKMSKNYPCHYTITTLMSLFGALMSTIFALFLERDWSQWKLGWNIRLLTVVYTGIVVSGAMMVVMTWCVDLRGPLYVSAFNPLVIVLVAIVGFLMLDEKLYLGSIIGGFFIICGLYVVLWGKGKEMKMMNQLVPSENLQEITVMRSLTEDKCGPYITNSDVDEVVRDNELKP